MTNNDTITLNHSDLKIAAQVAVEAIINLPEAYSVSTMQTVREVGIKAGVGDFYLDPLRILIADLS